MSKKNHIVNDRCDGTFIPSSWVIQPSTTIEDGLFWGDTLLEVHRIAYLCPNQLIHF